MRHPPSVEPFAGNRSRICPCGAVTERPGSLCRKCQAPCAWNRKSCNKDRRVSRDRTIGRQVDHQATRHSRQADDPQRTRTRRARQFRNGLKLTAGLLCLLRIIQKGAETRCSSH
jgi:hypothetical protein